MLAAITLRAKHAARKAALSTGAAICLLIGAAFLTVAGWIALVELTSTLHAALILGALWVGVGFVLLALAQLRPRVKLPPAEAAPGLGRASLGAGLGASAGAGLVEAFIFGFEAARGRSGRPASRRRRLSRATGTGSIERWMHAPNAPTGCKAARCGPSRSLPR